VKLQTVGQNWINNNKCTFICFACAEGLVIEFDFHSILVIIIMKIEIKI
jgi:hypothetical protein